MSLDRNAAIEAALDALDSELVDGPDEAPVEVGEGSTPAQMDTGVPTVSESTSSEPAATAPSEPAALPTEVQSWIESQGPEFQNLVKKYNGNVNQAASAYWETTKRLAAQAKGEPEAPAAETRPSEAPPTPTPVNASAELEKLESTLRDLSGQYTVLVSQDQALNNELETLEKTVQESLATLANLESEFDDIEEARANLAHVTSRRAQIATLKDSLMVRGQSIAARHSVAELRRDQTKERVGQETSRAAESRQAEETQIRSFVETFRAAIPKVAQEGDQFSPKTTEKFQAWAWKTIVMDPVLAVMSPSQMVAELPKLKAEFLELADELHRDRSANYARQKSADMSTNAPNGDDAIAPVTKRSGFRSPQEREAHIQATLDRL